MPSSKQRPPTSTGRRRMLTTLSLAASIASIGPARAQSATFPIRPIRLVVPFPPGGGADFMGRQLAQRLGARLPHPVVVDNRPGASGIIGSTTVAHAAPDGYTLLLATTGTHSSNPAAYVELPYHPTRDYVPVAIFADAPFMLCIHERLPIQNVAELIAYSKANPEALTYGSAGTGSSTHLGFEALKVATGIHARHVPYKGLPPAMADTLAGHLSMTFDSIQSALPQLAAKRLRVLGVGSAKRVPGLEQVPTLAESVPEFTLGSWYGVLAPSGTPAAIVERLNGEINALLATGEFRDVLAAAGATPLIADPARTARYLADDIARWRKVAVDLDIKVEK